MRGRWGGERRERFKREIEERCIRHTIAGSRALAHCAHQLLVLHHGTERERQRERQTDRGDRGREGGRERVRDFIRRGGQRRPLPVPGVPAGRLLAGRHGPEQRGGRAEGGRVRDLVRWRVYSMQTQRRNVARCSHGWTRA